MVKTHPGVKDGDSCLANYFFSEFNNVALNRFGDFFRCSFHYKLEERSLEVMRNGVVKCGMERYKIRFIKKLHVLMGNWFSKIAKIIYLLSLGFN